MARVDVQCALEERLGPHVVEQHAAGADRNRSRSLLSMMSVATGYDAFELEGITPTPVSPTHTCDALEELSELVAD